MLRAPHERHEPLANALNDEPPVELIELRVPAQEWRAILTRRPNVLVEGPDGSTEKVIQAVSAAIHEPICEWGNGSPVGNSAATLIVRRADLLGADEHRRLLEFLNAEGAHLRVRQVITTSARSLYALVESGLFVTELYYRLNTIRLELEEQATPELTTGC